MTPYFHVSILLYPQLGGLGWLRIETYPTLKEARAKRRMMLKEGHNPKRVKVD